VIARHLHDRASPLGRRHAESISRPLHDEQRHTHRIELAETARCGSRAGSTRRLQREGEADHSDGARRPRRAAGDPRARGAPANEKWQSTELAFEQVVDHRRPGSIELMRGCWRTPARHAIRLLDERNADSHRVRGLRHRNEIFRLHAAACAVAEHERSPRLVCVLDVRRSRTGRRADLSDGAVLSTRRARLGGT
jgi:hypothetical protein